MYSLTKTNINDRIDPVARLRCHQHIFNQAIRFSSLTAATFTLSWSRKLQTEEGSLSFIGNIWPNPKFSYRSSNQIFLSGVDGVGYHRDTFHTNNTSSPRDPDSEYNSVERS
ncbi:hypothetical protein CEXT_740691 [Caerostris extrusa]|uniref:Uncharacterized protein n=1 Tax=Caerostris extrusa TaxID=172846 RepID=A0AAV4V6S2_CAEEX|nr:hypothetical protein CEXT_740691 [Caerostris extrusa]